MTSAIHTAEDGGAARPFDALVLDGRLRQSLVTVRSLGRRGLSVAVMEAGEDVPAFRSRWCRRALSSGEAGADGYVARLEHALETTGARVVIPSHDGTIALLRLQAPRLQGRARIALAEEGATSIAVSKVRTLAVAERLGLRVPHRLALSDAGEVESALREVGLPAVVKPSESCPPGAPPGTRLVCQLVTTPAESVAAGGAPCGGWRGRSRGSAGRGRRARRGDRARGA